MDAVAISVQLGRYQAVVHYESCYMYSDTYHHSKLPIPPSVKWKLCHWCKPTAEDIARIASEITWLEKGGDVMNLAHTYGTGMLLPFTDAIEHDLAQRGLNGQSIVRDRYR